MIKEENTNNVGDGNIASVGIGDSGEPPKKLNKKKPVLRRFKDFLKKDGRRI